MSESPSRKPPGTRAKAPPRLFRQRLTREEQKAQRAQELLEAAWALFCERGYESLSIEDVAERAGYSRQPVYTLFGDKQNLFFELQSRATVEVMDLLFGNIRPGASLREVVVTVAHAVAEQLNKNKPTYGERLFIVAQTIAMSRPDIATKLEAQARWVIEQIAGVIRRLRLAEGEELRSEPEVIATHLAAHINGLTTVQFQTGNRLTRAEDLVEILLFLVFKSHAAPAPAR